ncbi:MAG: ArsR/SmtB family transcription factor [Christensenellales bacterium]|jgi:DNA-binding transcriptional ArsR family regulator
MLTEKCLVDVAELLKAIGHPIRLCIIKKLLSGSMIVSELLECIKVSQSNISQHLFVLRKMKIIECKRKGTTMVYTLIDENVRKVVSVFLK